MIRASMRNIFRELYKIYPASKVFLYVMDGLKSKNGRQRAGESSTGRDGTGPRTIATVLHVLRPFVESLMGHSVITACVTPCLFLPPLEPVLSVF